MSIRSIREMMTMTPPPNHQDYEIVQTHSGIELSGSVMKTIKGFSFFEGMSWVLPMEHNVQKTRAEYAQDILRPLLAKRKVSIKEVRDENGKIIQHDDRKFRVSELNLKSIEYAEGKDRLLNVGLGPSDFQAFRRDLQRLDKHNLTLQNQGRGLFNDCWAYFQRNPGVAGLVLSDSGSAYVGKRTNAEQMNALNSCAGHLKYHDDLGKVNPLVDLYREIAEEMGVQGQDVDSVLLVGAFGHPVQGHFDFTYVVQTILPDRFFAPDGAWKQRRSSAEHEELIRLSTPGEMEELLERGTLPGRGSEQLKLMYSTRGALEALVGKHSIV